jgi:hypothetical protein
MERLTERHRLLLWSLAMTGGWYPLTWMKSSSRVTTRSLAKSGFVKMRGGIRPVDVAITTKGRAALAQSEKVEG